MNSTVTAAIIAAIASFVTLIGTAAAQIYSIHRTKKDNEDTIEVTRKNTKDTIEGAHLDIAATLKGQTDQLEKTLGEQRARTLNERFATAADRLGSDKPAAVRLAAVYAMAGLAEDWEENAQICVDVLCGYLRLPYET